ncbi:MAG: MFS transporter [Alphaproteobacteria bacterium]
MTNIAPNAPKNPYFAVASIIFGMGLIQCGFGLLNVIAPALLNQAGYGADQIGVHIAISSAGFFFGTLVAPRLIQSVGHIRAFSVFAAIDAVGALVMTMSVDLWFWAFTRAAMGFALSGIFTVCESWISGETEFSKRGRVLAAYTIVYKLAQATAPLVITLLPAPKDGYEIARYFMVISGFFSLALLPVAITRVKAPQTGGESARRLSFMEVYKIAPASLVMSILISLSNNSVANLIPIYAIELGFGVAGGALFFSALQFGNLILQWPAGLLSDIYDRRKIMLILSLVVTATSIILAFFGDQMPKGIIWGLLALWGGCAMSVYSISIAHAGDRAQPHQMIGICSTLLMIFSLGMIIGPLISGQLISLFGARALFFFAGTMNVMAALYMIWRLRVNVRVLPAALRAPFTNFALTSLKLFHLDPRPLDKSPTDKD